MRAKGKVPVFICFTGIDGSGKTTLAKLLTDQLNRDGFECKYVYNRLTPFLLKPFIIIGQKLFLRRKSISENYAEYSATKRKALRNNPLSLIYQWLLLLDYSIQVFLKVKIPLMRGESIICDRYIYDTLVTDLAVDFSYSNNKINRTLNRFFRLFPRPELTFLVDVPEDVAYQRKSDIPSIEYLKERRGIYLDVGKEYGMVILDASRNLDNLENVVLESALKLMESQYGRCENQ